MCRSCRHRYAKVFHACQTSTPASQPCLTVQGAAAKPHASLRVARASCERSPTSSVSRSHCAVMSRTLAPSMRNAQAHTH